MRLALLFVFISTLVGMFFVTDARAQFDPLLIAPSTSTSTNPEEVDSRYTIKNRGNVPTPAASNSSPQQPPVTTPIQPPKKPPAPKFIRAEEERREKPEVITAPAITDEKYDAIPYDILKNILEIKTESFVIYNDSKSNYKYRNYNSFSQGLGLEVDVWINNDVGIETGYKTTINGSTPGMDHTIQLKHTERWFDFALQLRSAFDSTLSPFFVTKIGYSSYEKKMPVDNSDRATLKTGGPLLEFEVFLPKSYNHVWLFNFEIKPFQSHKEKAVGLNLASGDEAKTWSWGVGLGSRTIFNRKYQFHWNINYTMERSIFSGTTQQPDPWSNFMLTDVPVTNSFLFFNFGFIWGG